MTYDLRRLRLTGLIRQIEHTNRYVLTPDGIKVAVFSLAFPVMMISLAELRTLLREGGLCASRSQPAV
jgi:hypothetical protein